MGVVVKEVNVKSILSKSGIPGADYCINPYVGCANACRYCYADFMKKYTGHLEEWGSFVDAKINAPEVLQGQIQKAAKGNVIISSVTDPYQPLEEKYRLTRQCLEILLSHQFPVDILTKSPLVLRDVDLIKKFKDIEVGITIATDDDEIKRIFEPRAPSIISRINTLKRLHENGIKTYVFIGPLLPMNPEVLAERVRPYVDAVLIDRMNYVSKTKRIYDQKKFNRWLNTHFVDGIIQRLKKGFSGRDMLIC